LPTFVPPCHRWRREEMCVAKEAIDIQVLGLTNTTHLLVHRMDMLVNHLFFTNKNGGGGGGGGGMGPPGF